MRGELLGLFTAAPHEARALVYVREDVLEVVPIGVHTQAPIVTDHKRSDGLALLFEERLPAAAEPPLGLELLPNRGVVEGLGRSVELLLELVERSA